MWAAMLRCFETWIVCSARSCPSGDGALLERFLAEGDDSAFEALVVRHGPMVLGVCQRILISPHDADDAFQATFLVLARKAARLRAPIGSAPGSTESPHAWPRRPGRRLSATGTRH